MDCRSAVRGLPNCNHLSATPCGYRMQCSECHAVAMRQPSSTTSAVVGLHENALPGDRRYEKSAPLSYVQNWLCQQLAKAPVLSEAQWRQIAAILKSASRAHK